MRPPFARCRSRLVMQMGCDQVERLGGDMVPSRDRPMTSGTRKLSSRRSCEAARNFVLPTPLYICNFSARETHLFRWAMHVKPMKPFVSNMFRMVRFSQTSARAARERGD